ncbi:hypothetical protein BMT55_12155 [Listeria newyorkensis]|uniref:DUF2316 family protein n=1 Tax=Listeria newyorkensis TaxID=1497681 RepID=A0ABX4XLB6_9LIST|nr:DUF2316 family protein [Listeria newyorkensis]KGL46006.1 hypothetical protein EP58_02380 [Listeria newyorkensis]KMT59090.1 hypothetical protein X559_2878 [Listeria newyorkensis]PNP90555.1 hypothetical protein BMT55_12155 [Listeria newyorkensis]WAO20934.1 DUF2316 family protein [Listeria newyorkensis]SQC56165.1 Uncharacterized protein conserved in bacteria [Listeria newyorkensis]
MSLSPQQMKNTIHEFQQNFVLSGLTIEQIATELQTSPEKIHRILQLEQKSIEDPWILKEFLEQHILKSGKMPVPFSALQGNYHQYWFLKTKKIDKMQLSKGNN